jgi:hypothetical protein
LVDRIFGILNFNISKILFFVKHSKVKIFELDLPANRKPNREKELNLLSLKVCDHFCSIRAVQTLHRFKGVKG